MIIAFVMGVVAGFAFGFVFFRSERAYRQGWQQGEHYGRAEGYRQAWLKRNQALLSAESEDWSE
jgi:hypothetical protein